MPDRVTAPAKKLENVTSCGILWHFPRYCKVERGRTRSEVVGRAASTQRILCDRLLGIKSEPPPSTRPARFGVSAGRATSNQCVLTVHHDTWRTRSKENPILPAVSKTVSRQKSEHTVAYRGDSICSRTDAVQTGEPLGALVNSLLNAALPHARFSSLFSGVTQARPSLSERPPSSPTPSTTRRRLARRRSRECT